MTGEREAAGPHSYTEAREPGTQQDDTQLCCEIRTGASSGTTDSAWREQGPLGFWNILSCPGDGPALWKLSTCRTAAERRILKYPAGHSDSGICKGTG